MNDRHARHRHRPADPRRRPVDGYRAGNVGRFQQLVREALQTLPTPILAHLQQVELQIADVPPPEALGPVATAAPLTSYVPAGEAPHLPDSGRDRLVLYRRPLEFRSGNRVALSALIRDAVLQEVAHHLGIDDDDIEDRGWR